MNVANREKELEVALKDYNNRKEIYAEAINLKGIDTENFYSMNKKFLAV